MRRQSSTNVRIPKAYLANLTNWVERWRTPSTSAGFAWQKQSAHVTPHLWYFGFPHRSGAFPVQSMQVVLETCSGQFASVDVAPTKIGKPLSVLLGPTSTGRGSFHTVPSRATRRLRHRARHAQPRNLPGRKNAIGLRSSLQSSFESHASALTDYFHYVNV